MEHNFQPAFAVVINDCTDDNAFIRQTLRIKKFFPKTDIYPLRVNNTFEAAGCLIDTLDAAQDNSGIILTNVAPRNGEAKKWPNGSPFCYFYVKNILILSTFNDIILSLIKKFQFQTKVYLLDMSRVLENVCNLGLLQPKEAEQIKNTQFRSYEFLPRAAFWLSNKIDLPKTIKDINAPCTNAAIWWADNFGNLKTTLLPEEIDFQHGKTIKTKFGDLTCYNKLKDVEDGSAGIIIGSSGYCEKRFLEIVIQGGNAAKTYNAFSGLEIF